MAQHVQNAVRRISCHTKLLTKTLLGYRWIVVMKIELGGNNPSTLDSSSSSSWTLSGRSSWISSLHKFDKG